MKDRIGDLQIDLYCINKSDKSRKDLNNPNVIFTINHVLFQSYQVANKNKSTSYLHQKSAKLALNMVLFWCFGAYIANQICPKY